MSSRQVGFGAGPIWWETIQNYCRAKGLDESQTEAMHYHIRSMDEVYLKHLNRKK